MPATPLVSEVNRVRRTLGLEPLTAAFHLSPEELAEKARNQARNDEGQFVEEAAVKAELSGDVETVGSEEQSPPPPEEQPPPPAEPKAPRSYTGPAAVRALTRAGYDPAQAQQMSKNRVYTRDGQTFVAVPTVRAKAESAVIDALNTRDIARARNNRTRTATSARTLASAQKKLERAEAKAARASDRASAADQAQAAQVLGYLETAVAKLPDHMKRRGRRKRAFVASLDWGRLPGDDSRSDRAHGAAKVGGDTMWLNPDHVGDPVGGGSWNLPTSFATVGEYTVNHELGHMVSSGHSPEGRQVWRTANSSGAMSGYGRTNLNEGEAEMFAAFLGGNRSPVVMAYARAYGWGDPAAPPMDGAPEPAPTRRTSAPAAPTQQETPPDEVRTLTGDAARDALVAAGYNPEQAEKLADRLLYTADGHSFVVQGTPKSEVAPQLIRAKEQLEEAERRVRFNPRSENAAKVLGQKQRKLAKVQAMVDATPATVTPEQDAMARQVLGYLDTAVAKAPKHLTTEGDGKRRLLIASLDWERSSGAQRDSVYGVAQRGKDMMWLNPVAFGPNPPTVEEGHNLPTSFTLGEYVVNHELGHLLDRAADADKNDARRQTAFDGMSGYGATDPAEAYAEAFAGWQGGNRNAAVMHYAERFGWTESAEQPPPPPEQESGSGTIPAGDLFPGDVIEHEGAPVEVEEVETDSTGDEPVTRVRGYARDGSEVNAGYAPDDAVPLWVEPEPEPESDGVQVLTGDEAAAALEAAGRKAGLAKGRQVYTTDGRNFVTIDLPGKRQRETLARKQKSLEQMEDEVAAGTVPYGTPYGDRFTVEMDRLYDEVAALEAEVATLPDGVTADQDRMAREALGYLDKAASVPVLAGMKFVARLTDTLDVEEDAGGAIGQNGLFQISTRTFDQPTSPHVMQGAFDKQGEYAINHHLGHALDPRGSVSREEQDLWHEASARGLSWHGRQSAREGHAEAFTAWMGGDRSPIIEKYAQTFDWGSAEAEPETETEPEVAPEPEPDEQGRYSLTGQQAVDRLVAAGYDRGQAQILANGRVYTGAPGSSEFVVQSTPKSEAATAHGKAQTAARKAQERYRNGEGTEQAMVRAERKYERAKAKYEAASTEVTPEQEQMAHDALGYLQTAVGKLPDKMRNPNGRRKAFVVSMDRGLLPSTFGTRKPDARVGGQSILGGDTMWVNPATFNTEVSDVQDGWHVSTPFGKYGEYVINHELGHMVDVSSEADRRAAARAARPHMSRYGRSDRHESYAEAFTAWMGGDRSLWVQAYARRFGWGD